MTGLTEQQQDLLNQVAEIIRIAVEAGLEIGRSEAAEASTVRSESPAQSSLAANGWELDSPKAAEAGCDLPLRERIARAIWEKRPDCQGKSWPMETAEQRRAYPHNPIAACDLCFTYADAALKETAKRTER